jgi:hypothetical protein
LLVLCAIPAPKELQEGLSHLICSVLTHLDSLANLRLDATL